ncbi:MAG TPA: right-handed parallel beta-helix repeat-containing protein [Pirellulales bacterium]|nr:right-handed parallel beta-helix repeat-containing protein [Pirellulales bacterium]
MIKALQPSLVVFFSASAIGFTAEPRIVRTPLVLKAGGTPEKQAVFDGQGMVIDLGIDVTEQDWTKQGDVWTSRGPLFDRKPIAAGQLAGMFIDEVPLSIARDPIAERAAPAEKRGYCYLAPDQLEPGQMGYADDGSFYFRWPKHKSPGSARVILPPKPGTSCVAFACSYITVRNVTAMHAANDGFNIHGRWVGIRLENVRALSNADEGISAHDDTQVDVDGAEIAWNGSTAGGVADVNRCTTSYRNCRVHDNPAGAFTFTGKSHSVRDTLIYNEPKDFSIAAGTQVVRENVEWKRD